MSQKDLSPEDKARWEAFARTFLHAQKSLLARQKALEQQLKYVRGLGLAPSADSNASKYVRLSERLLASALENLQRLPLTATVYEPYSAMHEIDYAVRESEQTWLRIQMDALLYRTLAVQVQGVINGGAVAEDALVVFKDQMKAAQCEPARLEQWQRFLVAQTNLQSALEQPLQEWTFMSDDASFADKQAFFYRIQLPGLNGTAYRVRSTLRLLPQGEDVVKELREAWGGEVAKPPAEPKPRKAISERIRGVFKPAK